MILLFWVVLSLHQVILWVWDGEAAEEQRGEDDAGHGHAGGGHHGGHGAHGGGGHGGRGHDGHGGGSCQLTQSNQHGRK